jgi:hypothetical protein
MNKLDKIVEDKIKAEGWIKLLPTEKCKTTQPHRFRYTDGKTDSVSIIQYGALAGVFANFDIAHAGNSTIVYPSAKWKEKYKQVDWDTPECDCQDCLLIQGVEALEANTKTTAAFVRKLEGAEPETIVDIEHLQVDQAKNGYKKVTFYYKVSE